ncbi:3-methyl-2-oxobutanoate hydroxymethyltransferase [Pelagibius sp. Alg239-R121]|uniref:3-methyl-2-oxobutanoate hydroxymethyltransferase n=1 Tax=Pelagibius sp. Alg239-R121 TaxID=2993448 RepID=UPI0024A71F03|nr:3-methyl-2-oxobutanoate hydroxymethyltransferase [Pelagibius sp. Alg239-R121]
MPKLTVKDLLEAKGKRRLAFVQVAREEEAAAAALAGMDMIGTAFRPETQSFPAAAVDTHFQFGLPWGCHASAEEALRDAMRAMEAGADSIYCAMSPQIVEILAREGVPVIAHVGLVPPKATWVGGMRAVGRSAEQALQVYSEVRSFESAGAFAVEIEVVPARLAAEITRRVSLLTISLGSGLDCDVQYLFSADLLGENRGHIPRHAKVYRNFAAERDRLQVERVAAYGEYLADVKDGAFPEAGHTVPMADADFETLLSKIG